MAKYLEGVMLLNFLVNFLLLLGAGQLCGYPVRFGRAVFGAGLGGLYAGACLLPGFYFLGNFIWRIVSLGVISVATYGFSSSALRRGLIFVILCLGMGAVAMGVGQGGVLGIVCVICVLCVLCCIGLQGRICGTTYIPVELSYGKKHLRLTALLDTGNTLRDPISGQQVLVIGADAASELTGLTREQLQRPVESVGALPGLRLIPYRSIGSNGFLLALRLQNVKIGKRKESTLVAFAPEGFGREGTYQALTGGAV